MKLWLAALIAAIIAIVLLVLGPKPQYTQDGYTYAITMLMDRGIAMPQAERVATAFFKTQPAANDPELARYLGKQPEYWNLFRVRTVYSLLAAPLYPLRGFESLVDISRLAYVLTAILTVLLVTRFSSPLLGLLSAIALSLFPPWQDLARDALTDALAIALTTATLYTALLYVDSKKSRISLLMVFAVLCGLLTFTRPIIYIIDAALLIACVFDRSMWKLLVVAIGWTIVVASAASLARAPGFWWVVRDSYDHFIASGYAKPGEPLLRWYFSEEWDIALRAVVRGVAAIVPILAIIGVIIGRKRHDVQLLAGALIGTWLGAIVDPNRFDMIRCVVLPVGPAMLACASYVLVRAKSLVKIGPSA